MSKSVAKNALYNGIRTISSMLFPLVTFPYALRVLLAENLGKVDFGSSLISYFTLIATLGITTYATREGARVREDRNQLDLFSSQVFSINMVSTLIAYLLLALLVALWPHLHDYRALIAVQSVTIIGGAIGVEWVYTLEEDYGYITLRTVTVQLVSAILLFALVKGPEDYVIYASISVFASVGASIFNFFYARRYVTIRLTWDMDPRRHLAPILILFGNAIATTIYINVDVTFLNVMRGDYEVGLYTTSTRIYNLIKALLNSMTAVAIPRLSFYRANGLDDEYQSLLASIAHGIVVTILPALAALFLMADHVVLVVGGEGFIDSASPLRILCIAAIPALCASFTVNGILLTNGEEGLILRCSVLGAAVNLALNFFAIPLLGPAGAAATTLVAEVCVFVTSAWLARRYCDMKSIASNVVRPLITAVLAVILMAVSFPFLQSLLGRSLVSSFVLGAALVALYVLVLLLRRDDILVTLFAKPSRQDGAAK